MVETLWTVLQASLLVFALAFVMKNHHRPKSKLFYICPVHGECEV